MCEATTRHLNNPPESQIITYAIHWSSFSVWVTLPV